jgi:hypothetical protein
MENKAQKLIDQIARLKSLREQLNSAINHSESDLAVIQNKCSHDWEDAYPIGGLYLSAITWWHKCKKCGKMEKTSNPLVAKNCDW